MGIRLPSNSLSRDEIEYLHGQYKIVLGQIRRDNPDFTPYIGRYSPYSDRKINDAEDFDEYLRQLAISEICKKLYKRSWKADKNIIESQQAEISRLKKQIEQYAKQVEQEREYCKYLIILVIVLLLALYIIWQYFL